MCDGPALEGVNDSYHELILIFTSRDLRRVYTKQRACAQEIHRATLEALHNKSKCQSVDKVPAVETDVKLALHLWVCKANLGEDSIEVV